MTAFQLLMLGASAFFAYKIYEHIQTLQDPQEGSNTSSDDSRSADSFSTFSSESLVMRADEERESGNLDRAMAIYSEANIKAPKNAETLFKMGYTLVLQERYEEALEYFFESLEEDSENPFAYKEISQIYKKQGDEQKAEEYHKKAVAIDENI